MPSFLKIWWPVVLWSAIILIFSSWPHLQVPKIKWENEDKFYHFAEFFIWGIIFLWRASKLNLLKPGANPLTEKIFLALLIGIIFAFIDEYHQKWVPGRDFDRYDLFADMAGLALSSLIFLVFRKPI